MFCFKCRCLNATNVHKVLNRRILLSRKQSLFSTLTQENQPHHEVPYYRSDKNVLDHSDEDYSKFYTFPTEDIQSRLKDVVPNQFHDLSRPLKEHTMLLRKPSLNVISKIKETSDNTAPRFVLYGPSGSGKTLSLLHIVQYCVQNEWVIVHVPNAFRFMDSQNQRLVQESQWKTGRVDQPDDAVMWLATFQRMNPKFLEQVNTTQDYKWGKREATDKGQPLLDVLQQGIGRSLFSTDAVGVLLKEIRQNTKLNILYSVDAFNGFLGKTSYKLNGIQVNQEDLSLRHHFTKLLKPEHSLSRGAYVMALSQSVQYLNDKRDLSNVEDMLDESYDFKRIVRDEGLLHISERDSDPHLSHLANNRARLLQQTENYLEPILYKKETKGAGFEIASITDILRIPSSTGWKVTALHLLGEFDEIEVPNYSQAEYLSMMRFYKDVGWLTREISDQLLDEMRFLTNLNPKQISRFCASL